MTLRSQRAFLIGGILLILVANVAVFLGVRANRQLPTESTLLLTERELPPSTAWSLSPEDSGLSLQLTPRILMPESENPDEPVAVDPDSSWGSPPWLTFAKLKALGFALGSGSHSDEERRRVEKQLPREVFVVLELNGDSYRRALQEAQSTAIRHEQQAQADPNNKNLAEIAEISRKRADAEQSRESRLFCIDAGLDPVALRKSYPDRSHFAIARGSIAVAVFEKAGHWRVTGQFVGLRIPRLNVPLIYRPVFGASRQRDYADSIARGIAGETADQRDALHYNVSVAWGRRLEPWITAATSR